MTTGSWRVVPGATAKGRPFWMVGIHQEDGTVMHVQVNCSLQPRRWFTEKGARDHVAAELRARRWLEQQAREQRRARAVATCWPFPVSSRPELMATHAAREQAERAARAAAMEGFT